MPSKVRSAIRSLRPASVIVAGGAIGIVKTLSICCIRPPMKIASAAVIFDSVLMAENIETVPLLLTTSTTCPPVTFVNA